PNDSDSDSDSLYDGPLIDPSRTEPEWNIDSDGDGMINALDTDSENDGTPDGVDLDPLHDLLVKVKITRLEVEDPIDFDIVTMSRTVRVPYLSCSWSGCRIKYRSFTIYYPAPVFDRRAEPYFRVSIADQWNSGHWLHSEVPVASDTEVYSPGNPPVFVANVPDDQPQVPVSIQAWDMDIGPDDLLDLADGTGQTFYLTFDLETAASHPLGGYGIAGSTSGSADGSYGADEDDARILFSISLDYELSYQEQVALAQKFRPQLYFDQDETWRPRDIQEYLSHSTLETSTGALVDATPTPAEIAGLSDLYLNLDDTYHSQDSSTYGLKIYSHVFTTYRNRIVVQYWFCYLYNDGINNHEGDWEMIQVVLPAKGSADVDDLIPLAAGYSWHYYIQRKVWSSPLLLKAGDTHPVVFIEKGGHGSQFVPLTGTYDGEDMSQYSIGIISNQDWLLFRGYWGEKGSFEFTTGPPGPVFRSTDNLELSYLGENYDAYMWTDPIFWINYVLELVDVL
ncbi:MAG: hypothetical protein ACFFCP_01560, partial [Promethearchaeota archaeon]